MRPAAPTLLAVDGNSLGHRAFHSVRTDAEAAGLPIPPIAGAVVTMLASAWVEGPYHAVIVAFDHAENRRKHDHPEYKANRVDEHPELTGRLADLRQHLDACGFMVVEHGGAEADDVLAAIADACTHRTWRCDLLSSDRDLTALVGPTTRLLRPRATFSDLRVEDEKAVRATYGIDPDQYTDLAALRGDPSDGLDGARGIGPKTAARLLRDHDNVPGIYASLHDLPPKLEATLREARERVERNLMLMAPIPRLHVDVEAALARGIDVDRVAATLGDLGLETAARRFMRAVSAPPAPPAPPPPDTPPEEVPPLGTDRARIRMAGPAEGEQVALF